MNRIMGETVRRRHFRRCGFPFYVLRKRQEGEQNSVKRECILFDLDGTLTDPGLGITRSVQYALRTYGIEVADLTKLYPFIGPPLKDSFMRFYGFPEAQAAEAIGRYREYYTVKGIFENAVYDGIPEMLGKLKTAGASLAVATSKPEEFAVQILKHFNLYEYFDAVGGASMDEVRVKKGEVIGYTLKKLGTAGGKGSIMAGDREHDVAGARENGLDCVGVLFGYGSREELKKAGAYSLAETVSELEECLLREVKG